MAMREVVVVMVAFREVVMVVGVMAVVIRGHSSKGGVEMKVTAKRLVVVATVMNETVVVVAVVVWKW